MVLEVLADDSRALHDGSKPPVRETPAVNRHAILVEADQHGHVECRAVAEDFGVIADRAILEDEAHEGVHAPAGLKDGECGPPCRGAEDVRYAVNQVAVEEFNGAKVDQ